MRKGDTRQSSERPSESGASQSPDFAIDAEGRWFHMGAEISRKALAKLFADRALKMDEAGRYWLQSPFEKYPIAVADVPFLIVDYEHIAGGFDFITNMDERIPVGAAHPIELRQSAAFDGMELPYIHVRDGLYARLGRSVYYNLLQEFGAEIKSRGAVFALGRLEA
ncbi:MAG: DUF1285 domain-containing protein [Alphaproteobacteria bacterium]